MFYMNIPKYLWGDAILTASYLINRMPTKILQYTTPQGCLKKVLPKSRINSELPLKIFGCTAYVHIPKRSTSKLDPRAEKCVFVGYTPNKKGYKCFNPLIKRFYTTMDVSVEYNVCIVYYLSLLIQVTCMVVRTPSLVYIYLSIVSRDQMNKIRFFSFLSLSLSTWYQSQRRKPNFFSVQPCTQFRRTVQ